jgi:hypothetical protein
MCANANVIAFYEERWYLCPEKTSQGAITVVPPHYNVIQLQRNSFLMPLRPKVGCSLIYDSFVGLSVLYG